ncbi:MAG TPA: hypothetical protein PLZ51_29645, partial [Aggregatilineales bacterium]|nr:hypothetical protein [Aggregatilineales bacterium]
MQEVQRNCNSQIGWRDMMYQLPLLNHSYETIKLIFSNSPRLIDYVSHLDLTSTPPHFTFGLIYQNNNQDICIDIKVSS